MIYKNKLSTKFYRMLRPLTKHECPGGPYEWALWGEVFPVLWGLFYLPKGEPFWLDMDGFYPLVETRNQHVTSNDGTASTAAK